MKTSKTKSKNLPWIIRNWYVPVITLLALLITVLTILSIPSWVYQAFLGVIILAVILFIASKKMPNKLSFGGIRNKFNWKNKVSSDEIVIIIVAIIVIFLIKTGYDYFSKKPSTKESPATATVSPTVVPPTPSPVVIKTPLSKAPPKALKEGINHLKKGVSYHFIRDKRDIFIDLQKDGVATIVFEKYNNRKVRWEAKYECVDGITTTEINGNTIGNGGNYRATPDRDMTVKFSYQ